MKVAYINTVYRIKSTGRTYAELKEYLEKNGHECKAFYGVGHSDEANTYLIGSKFTYLFHNLMSRITGLEGYFSFFATRKLIKQLKKFDPDVIHLGSVHGHYVNLRALYKYLKDYDKPVFMTTHDCWGFTGKCPQFTSMRCDRWMTQCHNCPSKKVYPISYFFDFSRKMYKDKKKWLTSIEKLNVIAVSEWIGEQVKRSFLKDKKVFVNYNWIDTENFVSISEEERKKIRKEVGVGSDDFLIIAVSSNWNKDMPRYQDLSKLMNKLQGNQRMLVVGAVRDEFEKNDRVKFISFVSDVKYLAKLYGCAEVFVHFSVEDSFGKVIAEAQACGVPAIVYDSTDCPEVARIGNGYVVPARDVEEAYNQIKQIASKSYEQRETERQMRAEKVKNVLSKETRAANLLKIYQETL